MPQPTLHIIVFSNFEGFCQDPAEARRIVQGFEALSNRDPDAVWTHMFNPIHLLAPGGHRDCAEVFLPFLREQARREPRTEMGLHMHMFYKLAQAIGVEPRSYPHAKALPENCGHPRDMEGDGYDVLLTGYTHEERNRLIQGCVDAYVLSGLARPTSFCAGYSAADPALQAMLDQLCFVASFAAQAVPPGIKGVSYPPCWYKLLDWADHITPLSKPYRVAVDSIRPPAGPSPLLDHLVEIPLNTDTDVRPPYLYGRPVTRPQILDLHYEMVRITGRNSCVALGLHDVYLGKDATSTPVMDEMMASLDHVRRLMKRNEVDVRFSTASQVARDVLAKPHRW